MRGVRTKMTNPANLWTSRWRAARAFIRPELLIGLAIIGAALVTPSIAMQGDTVANRVLGQVDFVHNGLNLIDASGMLAPQAVAIDASVSPNRLYVSDSGNSRVLGYKDVATFVNGGGADLVIGQPDFLSGACDQGTSNASANDLCDPVGVAVDADGNLYVADTNNSRVLEYHTPFSGCGSFPCVGPAANLVFGQGGSFTASGCNSDSGGSPVSSASDLCDPLGVAVAPNGDLYVADANNNRVLEYSSPQTSATANNVFGQGGSFASSGCNSDTGGSSTASASDLCDPVAVALDPSGDLYVADSSNNRVLEYSIPLTSATANNVFGQGGSFTSTVQDNGGVSASSLNAPIGVAADGSGNLYIADSNNRVLEYSDPLTNQTAGMVLGQSGNFASGGCNSDTANLSISSADDLCLSSSFFGTRGGVAADGAGNVYVADFGNNRVLVYDSPLISGTSAGVVLGQLDFAHNGENLIDARGMDNPESVAIDTSTVPNRLYVSDTDNSRVLGYRDVTTFVNGGAADLVIGQPDFQSGSCDMRTFNATASDLCNPVGIAVDAGGNLYVADSNNSRVLEYTAPFSGCGSFPCVGGPANLVFGQGGSFTSNIPNNPGLNASSLDDPVGVALDGSGNLYVADLSNSRVLEYDSPLTTDTIADRVYGQGGSFTSGNCTAGAESASTLCNPVGVVVDGSGHLFVADTDYNRVLEYKTPLTTEVAAVVIGQIDFASGDCNNGGVSASGLCFPDALAVDGSGNLFVADGNNSRVLEFAQPLTNGMSANWSMGRVAISRPMRPISTR